MPGCRLDWRWGASSFIPSPPGQSTAVIPSRPRKRNQSSVLVLTAGGEAPQLFLVRGLAWSGGRRGTSSLLGQGSPWHLGGEGPQIFLVRALRGARETREYAFLGPSPPARATSLCSKFCQRGRRGMTSASLYLEEG